MGHRASGDFHVRTMRADEIGLVLDWAAAEGWNPGLADAPCFAAVDPGGFLVGEFEGKPAATISTVVYDDRFAFLGFYIVRPDLRGRGFGMRIWQAGMAHAGTRSVGLDGVVAQQANYRKSGFVLAHTTFRYGGVPLRAAARPTPRCRCARCRSNNSSPATPPSIRQRVPRSSTPGSAPPAIAAARSSATESWRLGA